MRNTSSRHRCAVFCALLLLPIAANASLPYPPDTLWAVTYDAGALEKAYDAHITDDGGYILCGSTTSSGPGNVDAYLVKTDSIGTAIWVRSYGGARTEEVFEIRQTSDGGYAAVGYTSTNTLGYFDVYFIRLDAGGDTLWTRTYGGSDYDYGYSFAETPDGGFLIGGRTSSFGKGWRSAYFIRTDSGGDTLWTKAHGGWGKDEIYSVQVLPDGGFVAAGYTESYGAGGRDMWLLRLDADGDTLWTRTFGASLDERAEDIKRTVDRGFIIVGRSNSFNPPFYDMYAVRADAYGDTLWTRTYGGASTDHAYCVSLTLDGGFIITGYTDSYGAGGRDAYMVRCDAAGDTLWTKTLGAAGTDYGYSAEQSVTGGYMLSGWTSLMGAGDGDAYLATLAPSGGCPLIQEVADIPSDDGGFVEVSWLPSFYDGLPPDDGIARYKIWREIGAAGLSFVALGATDREIKRLPVGRHELREDGSLYVLVGQVPAVAGSVYTFPAPTECGPDYAGPCRGCYIVSAHTGKVGERFNSPVMCGYSIDNLGASDDVDMPDGGETAQEIARQVDLRVIGPASDGRPWRAEFSLPADGHISIDIFDVRGRKVMTAFEGFMTAGSHSIDASAGAAACRLAPGTYFLRLEAPSATKSASFVLVR